MAGLAILVPVYQREQDALRAVRSVVSQAGTYLDRGLLSIQLRDDASPAIDARRFSSACRSLHPRIEVAINPSNLGMSENIRLMVQSCTASFCTILTDDDWFEPGSIDVVMETIERLDSSPPALDVASLFCPRYSYTEAGNLVGVSCRIAMADRLLMPSPASTMKLVDKGYILTGLFFDRGWLTMGSGPSIRAMPFSRYFTLPASSIVVLVYTLTAPWCTTQCLTDATGRRGEPRR